MPGYDQVVGPAQVRSRSSSCSSSELSKPSRSEVVDDGRALDRTRKRRRLSPPARHATSRSSGPDAAGAPKIQPKISTSAAARRPPTTTTADLSFASLRVQPWLVASLTSMAITRPTPIQRACIPKILDGCDCVGGSRTGSGKTIAFAIPIIQRWAEDPRGIFALVLTPTRELALQMFEQFKAISASQALKVALVTGGGDMRDQALNLSRSPHVVIATPGRLADHIRSSGEDTIRGFRRTGMVVLDEADRLLASGPGSMLADVEECLSAVPAPHERQTLLFTATVTAEVRALKDMPRGPGRAEVFVCELEPDAVAVPATLEQTYLAVPVTHRESYLHVLFQTAANVDRSVIVFCNRTRTADFLTHLLRLLEHRVTALHSRLPQRQRIDNLGRFRARAARILVATDVAARGLDIPQVGLVVNYDVPHDADDYIHRVGRTARAGRQGRAITLVGQRDVRLILNVEARVGRKMTEYVETETVSHGGRTEQRPIDIEARVIRDALKIVGEKKREAALEIEEGREVGGKRNKRMTKLER